VVDRVSRTAARGVYAAGDCTGVNALASVAAMQGRIAMWHALGDSVSPLDLRTVSANVFTSPEIATVGISEVEVSRGNLNVATMMLPLAGNARAKMQALDDGFVKLFALPTTGIIIGAVVVAPSASELIHSLSIAVRQKLTVDQLAESFTVYPSLSGSIAEVARQLSRSRSDRVETRPETTNPPPRMIRSGGFGSFVRRDRRSRTALDQRSRSRRPWPTGTRSPRRGGR